MKPQLPEGWSMRQCRDSVFSFNKLIHWSETIDPPPDSYGYDDTMTMFVRFHPVQNDSAREFHSQRLEKIKIGIEDLKEHRNDSIYRGKRGFYDWWGKLVHLKTEQLWFEYVYFKNCSITYSYWDLFDKLKNYDEEVDEEAKRIQQILVGFLNDH